ncbi:6-phosphogluconolactonase [Beijerinckia sp. L45]|uniref:6-phosphogluconolactonase n=1 Tax=Beijerinckia sp. L45 TaxID=1641855 RepID=UPI00131D159B|nr:6-phosphogluconolactonase [Beijerinckia sp. L45]
MPRADLDVSADSAALAARIADWLVDEITGSTGPFALNLSGGSTPKALYTLLATDKYRAAIDWPRVHLFFGDERFVPKDHPDSNFRMANEAMISHVPIPADNVHPVETESGTPEEAAAAYQRTLQAFYGKTALDSGRPLFAVTLLGLGDDGHTASLFPGTQALHERDAWVTAVIGAKPEPRISLTYPCLDSSHNVAFLVAGAAKHAMLTRVLDKDPTLPASHVETSGRLIVFCDTAAAGDLTPSA